MFGLSMGEVFIVALIVFLLFGSQGFQEGIRTIFKLIKSIRDEIDKIKQEVSFPKE